MKNELREIVLKSINKLGKRKKQIVAVDIGANDGTLLSFYPKTFFRVGIDPIKKFAKECKRYANILITDFFFFVQNFFNICDKLVWIFHIVKTGNCGHNICLFFFM
ncbi:MAG: hypothetical protein M1365_16035, partial [Actinobacteria bacterium]|nr:hypothetical protein [Actinomycetota bacterium]